MTVPLKVYAELGLGRKFQELKKEVQISRNIKGVSGEAKINMALRTRYDQIRKMMSIAKKYCKRNFKWPFMQRCQCPIYNDTLET